VDRLDQPAGKTVRWWDIAATRPAQGKEPDYTAGVKLARLKDGRFAVLDVRRLRSGPADVESLLTRTAEEDGKGVEILIPQDPGAAGIITAEYFRRRLAGWNVRTEKETGKKDERAKPFSAQWDGGNVLLLRGQWLGPYLDELEAFPFGAHDDQVDASSGAFSKLARPSGLDYVQWLKQRQEADMKPQEGQGVMRA